MNKSNIKLEEKKRDTIERISVKINYSYLSGLDLFFGDYQTDRNRIEFEDYYGTDLDKNTSKSGIISLSFHYRANKYKYGIGMNFSNYKASYLGSDLGLGVNKQGANIYDLNININNSHRILTPFVTIERFLNKNLYLGLHLGCNFIKTESKERERYNYIWSTPWGEELILYDREKSEVRNVLFPYTKFCIGYEIKLSNQLNLNLELGIGGSMTNTGFAYLFR